MSQPTASRVASIAKRVDQASGLLSTRALRRMEETLPWFNAMEPLPRSQVGLLVQAGVLGLAAWIRTPKAGATISADVFATAPRELARVISLEQTVQLVRVAVEVVEESVEEFATPATIAWAREAVLRYSREIAFAAAGVYARAAEQRGAWDARLEALVVDAIVRGDVSDSLRSRASALGWSDPAQVVVIAGSAPSDETERVLTHTRRLGHEAGAEVLTGVQSGRLVVIAGSPGRINRVTKALLPAFADGPVVVGAVVTNLVEAAVSVQDVFAALRAVSARPTGPRPVAANDLLPERALAGDARATRGLIAGVYAPLLAEPTLLETADALVDSGGAIEAAARRLFVHANTVRYRTRRIAEISGYDLANARERYVVQTAMALGRMDGIAEQL
ncbi:MAG TPA: helix-turn-helix domain-containing protein [Mycobacteriales bacterium]|nr:helix-turn-helix domain-containing protein [Mycobacteriales bacterium]